MIDYTNREILRLQSLIKKLEQEIHDCTIEVLEIGELARKVEKRDNATDSIVIAVNDACSDVYHKYDYRVRGFDAENIILAETEDNFILK